MSTMILEEGSEWLQRAGLGTTIESWEDGLREQPRPGSLEWWYFDAHLEDGSSLVAVFMTKPLAASAGMLSPCILAQLTLPSGEIINAVQPFPVSQFQASRDGCNVHIGPNWLRRDLHRYEFSLETPALSMHLAFTGILAPARIGTGEIRLSEKDTFGWLVAVPRGTVTGTITLRGQTRSVSGLGYHDHNWGSLPFEDFLEEAVAVPEVARFIWSQGTDQVSLTLDQTRLISREKQGPMLMLRFLADAQLQLHIGDVDDEVRGQVLYEHPTFYKE